MKTLTRAVIGALAVLAPGQARLSAQVALSPADSVSALAAAVAYARTDLLSPNARPVLVLERGRTRAATWDSSTAAALGRALSPDSGAGAERIRCASARTACKLDPATQLVSVSDISAAADSVFITIGVTRIEKSTIASWRAREYVLVRRDGKWRVDRVRQQSVI